MKRSIAREPIDASGKNLKAELRAALLDIRQHYQPNLTDEIAIANRVLAVLAERKPRCVGFYWPLPGEFDARALLTRWLGESANRHAALPVVNDLAGPLSFCRWTPDAKMMKGRFQIPVPADAIEEAPDLLLIPCVGFDQGCYRLGYGGGYYDRTLKRASSSPFALGIAYEYGYVDAIPREAHDVPLDLIVSELAQYNCEGAGV